MSNCKDCEKQINVLNDKNVYEQLVEQRSLLIEQLRLGNTFASVSIEFIDNMLSQFTNNENNKCKGCGE